MQLQLITPEKILFEGEAQQVQVPGTEGEFGVLTGHAPFISTLKPGVITITLEDGATQKIGVLGGIAEVLPERCTLLIENAKDVSSITQADAQSQLDEAKAALSDAETDGDKKLAEAKIALAEAVLLAA